MFSVVEKRGLLLILLTVMILILNANGKLLQPTFRTFIGYEYGFYKIQCSSNDSMVLWRYNDGTSNVTRSINVYEHGLPLFTKNMLYEGDGKNTSIMFFQFDPTQVGTYTCIEASSSLIGTPITPYSRKNSTMITTPPPPIEKKITVQVHFVQILPKCSVNVSQFRDDNDTLSRIDIACNFTLISGGKTVKNSITTEHRWFCLNDYRYDDRRNFSYLTVDGEKTRISKYDNRSSVIRVGTSKLNFNRSIDSLRYVLCCHRFILTEKRVELFKSNARCVKLEQIFYDNGWLTTSLPTESRLLTFQRVTQQTKTVIVTRVVYTFLHYLSFTFIGIGIFAFIVISAAFIKWHYDFEDF